MTKSRCSLLNKNSSLFRQQTKIFKFVVEETVKVTVLCPFVPCVAANCFPGSNYFCVNTELAPVRHKYSELECSKLQVSWAQTNHLPTPANISNPISLRGQSCEQL